MRRRSTHAISLTPVMALAGVLATGCGGQSSPEDSRSGDLQGSEAPAPEVSGIDPPVQGTSQQPTPVLDGPASLPPEASGVEVTTDVVQLASAAGTTRARLFTARSPMTTLEVIEAGERLCVRGQLLPVPDGDYANYWGAEVGLILGSGAPTDVAPAGAGLAAAGFGFRLEGDLPPQLRLRVGAAGEVPANSQYCQNVDVAQPGEREVSLASLTFECWAVDGAPFPGAASATLVSWQIPASEATGDPFDFCVEDIHALP